MEQILCILIVLGGGMLYCDWWFINEVVLIDIVGCYVCYDDGGEVSVVQCNVGEWQGFFGLLCKYCFGVLFNGVILMLNVVDLIVQLLVECLVVCVVLWV